MKKVILFAVITVLLTACNNNAPTKAYEGVWEPINFGAESIVITSDSIYGIYDNKHIFQHHYQLIRDNAILFERCWIADTTRPDYQAEEAIYFDKDNQLIIENFAPSLAAVIPLEYYNLILRKK